MNHDLVSVIVPTYNRADCILETLQSLRTQTHANWELILVDDGSTDNTRDLVTTFFQGDARLNYIAQPNAGVSNARNTGLQAARGDFIAFLDSDDRWMPWKLSAQLACMQAYPDVGMVWTDMATISPDGIPLTDRHLRTMYSAYRFHTLETLFHGSVPADEIGAMPALQRMDDVRFYYGDIYAAMIRGSLVHTSTVLLRSERARLVGGFDETLKHSGEDYDFHLRTCQFGPVGLLDVSTIEYRKNRGDRLTRHTDASAMNFLATIQKAVAADVANRLPATAVKQTLAEAHGWIAEEKFKLGDGAGVRRHALRSLLRKPGNIRLFVLMAASLLPLTFRQRVITAYRAAKRAGRSTA
ncbi:MAG: glycosyltransferase family 2 protein [Terriglobus sp.]